MKSILLICATLLFFWASNSRSAVLYVDVNSAYPAPPFDSLNQCRE